MKNIAESIGAAEGLPTASDLAKAKTKFDPTPLTTAILNHLRGERIPVPPEAMRDGQILVLPMPDETVRAVAFNAGFEVTEDELTALRVVQSWMDASVKTSQPFALSNVALFQQKQREAIEAKMVAGESTADIVIESRDTINRTFLAHLNAAEAARKRKTTDTLLPLCKPILERFWAALEQTMREIEETDRATALAFSLPYEPSQIWRACFYLATIFKPASRLGITSTWTTPGQLLGGLFS
jgi:hypothetical protein